MGLSTLYFTNYKNYYNRQAKVLPKLVDYGPYIRFSQQGVSFNPGDGVYTTQVANFPQETHDTPSYLIVVREDNEIDSRWFIADAKRKLTGQYELSLYRDTIADYFDLIKTAPMFIEKGTLPAADPMIFNSENMTYNQIKTKETLLKDTTGIAWLVGYYARNAKIAGNVVKNDITDEGVKVITTPLAQFPYYKYSELAENYEPFAGVPSDLLYTTTAKLSFPSVEYMRIVINAQGNIEETGYTSKIDTGLSFNDFFDTITNASRKLSANYKKYGMPKLVKETRNFYSLTTDDSLKDFLALDGKTILDSTGKYYDVKINTLDRAKTIKYVAQQTGGSLYLSLQGMIKDTGLNGTGGAQGYQFSYVSDLYNITYTERTDKATKYDLTSASKLKTIDAPYDMFAIPFGLTGIYVEETPGVFNTFWTDPALGLSTAMSMIANHPTEIYDIQLLPYCPCPQWFNAGGVLTLTNKEQYSYITTEDGATKEGIIINVPKSKFHTIINLSDPVIITEPKIESECDKYRLVSPNYNGQFEFNAAKNGGITKFDVDCYYKPYSPYIHLNPDFGRLYGKDFDDARGLICGGDFSLTSITDQWKQYEIQNKNYLNSFNRQIENMEITNKYGFAQDIVSATLGSVQSTAYGAMTGGMIGGPVGGAVGGVIGGIGSVGAGIADVAINQALRNEAMDLTKDQFGYQLGNIQALPYSLNRVNAFTANNKIFPFLEYYTCTEKEKQALRDKIRYNGMSVGRIGTIQEFSGYMTGDEEYIKGKLIRLEIDDDTHLVNTIAAELNQGIYIGGNNE